jgi:hypothetical protein
MPSSKCHVLKHYFKNISIFAHPVSVSFRGQFEVVALVAGFDDIADRNWGVIYRLAPHTGPLPRRGAHVGPGDGTHVRRGGGAWVTHVRRGGALSCLVTAYLSDDDGRRETCESFMLPQKHQKEHLQIKISCYN